MYKIKTCLALCLAALYALPTSAMKIQKNKKKGSGQYQKKIQTPPVNKALSTSQPTKDVAAIVADAQPKVTQELSTPAFEAPIRALVEIVTTPQQGELIPKTTITTEVLEETLSASSKLAQASTPNAIPAAEQAAEKADSTTEAPKTEAPAAPTYVAGLGALSSAGDWWYGKGQNIIYQIEKGGDAFQAKHPDQQNRTATALKELINANDVAVMGTLLKMLVGIQFEVENSGRMKEVYAYLKDKQVASEKNAYTIISKYLENARKNVDDDCKKCQTAFGAQLPLLQLKIQSYLNGVSAVISQEQETVNYLKKGRLNCIKINKKSSQDYTGYNSDTDENAPSVYNEELFLKRANISLYDDVQDFRKKLEANHTELCNVQQQFEKISFLPAPEKKS